MQLQFVKVKIDNNNWLVTPSGSSVAILSYEVLFDPMEYIQFVQDDKKWNMLTNYGYTTYNTYHYININHKFDNLAMIEISNKVKHLLREDKLKQLLNE